MGCSMPGFPVLHYSPEFAQTHVHWVGDAIQPSHPLTVSPFSSCLQSFLASESFLMSQLFTSGSHHSEAYTSFKRFHVQRTRCFAFSSSFFFNCSGFCHTLKWNSHGFTCVPHPDPPSHLPLHPIPLGLPSAPGPSAWLMHPTWAGDQFHPR